MLNFLPKPLVGIIASLLLAANIFFWCWILFTLALVKFLIPFKSLRHTLDPAIIKVAEAWIACNSGWMALTQNTRWDVKGGDSLNYRGWYLVNSNHQTWVDILILQHALNGKIPLLKFFLKQELIKVPIMGLAWWALDFPFMKRYSKDFLAKNPEMRGKDLETTRKACEKFALMPTSVMNFLEGTRFTEAKHQRQQSPYKHLLKPKAGGIAFALNAMGDKFQSLVNITIAYPDKIPTFWDFLCGRLNNVIVRIEELPIPEKLITGDYNNDPEFRKHFQQWVHGMWQDKDQLLDELLKLESEPPINSRLT